jgi:hypothetical protein
VKSQAKQNRVLEALQLAQQVGMPAWVDVNADKAEGVFKAVPTVTSLLRMSTNR